MKVYECYPFSSCIFSLKYVHSHSKNYERLTRYYQEGNLGDCINFQGIVSSQWKIGLG